MNSCDWLFTKGHSEICLNGRVRPTNLPEQKKTNKQKNKLASSSGSRGYMWVTLLTEAWDEVNSSFKARLRKRAQPIDTSFSEMEDALCFLSRREFMWEGLKMALRRSPTDVARERARERRPSKKNLIALHQERSPINRIINWTNVSLKRLLQATVTATSVF